MKTKIMQIVRIRLADVAEDPTRLERAIAGADEEITQVLIRERDRLVDKLIEVAGWMEIVASAFSDRRIELESRQLARKLRQTISGQLQEWE